MPNVYFYRPNRSERLICKSSHTMTFRAYIARTQSPRDFLLQMYTKCHRACHQNAQDALRTDGCDMVRTRKHVQIWLAQTHQLRRREGLLYISVWRCERVNGRNALLPQTRIHHQIPACACVFKCMHCGTVGCVRLLWRSQKKRELELGAIKCLWYRDSRVPFKCRVRVSIKVKYYISIRVSMHYCFPWLVFVPVLPTFLWYFLKFSLIVYKDHFDD